MMTLAVTQSDFRAHMKRYLDQINENDETVYIARSNNRSVAVISQAKLYWMEHALMDGKDSADYAVARDQLIRRHVLPDDEAVEPDDKYWNRFKS